MKNTHKNLFLLPIYFRKIAFGVIIFSIIHIILFNMRLFVIDAIIQELIITHSLLISLFILMITKNKLEDERTLLIRLKSFSTTFLTAILIVVTEPIYVKIVGGELSFSKNVYSLLLFMFIFYFIIFFLMKRK